jgi:hypothetical protein
MDIKLTKISEDDKNIKIKAEYNNKEKIIDVPLIYADKYELIVSNKILKSEKIEELKNNISIKQNITIDNQREDCSKEEYSENYNHGQEETKFIYCEVCGKFCAKLKYNSCQKREDFEEAKQ